MKKNKKYILFGICSIIVATLLVPTYDICCYLRGVRYDVERSIDVQKSFIKEYSFSGRIIRKDFRGIKAQHPYFLTIKLDTNAIIPLNSFYFFFDFDLNNRTLQIDIPKYIYETISIGEYVSKERDSDSIKVNQQAFLLLSKKRFEWIYQ